MSQNICGFEVVDDAYSVQRSQWNEVEFWVLSALRLGLDGMEIWIGCGRGGYLGVGFEGLKWLGGGKWGGRDESLVLIRFFYEG